MKRIFAAALLILGLIAASIPAVQAQTSRETLRQYVSDLQKNPDDYALREKIIQHVQTMSPAPAIPEEARKYINRGMAAAEDAKNESDFRDAAEEFQKSVNLAPWLGAGYRGLAITQDKSGQYSQALQNLKLFLLTNPSAADAEAARTLRDKIEYRMEKAAKESSPEAIASNKQNDFQQWLKKIDGRRYTTTGNCLADGVTGTIDIRGNVLVFGGYVNGQYRETSHVEIQGHEISDHWVTAVGRYSQDVAETLMINEEGDRITEARQYRDGEACKNTYLWQK